MSPDHLAAAAGAKRADALARAEVALRELGRTGKPVSFQAVARHARVSRQWLYKQPRLRSEIERLRARPAVKRALPAVEQATKASLRQRVEDLLDENRRLRRENTELSEELALAYGHQRSAS